VTLAVRILSAAEVAANYGVKQSHVWVLAHRHGWRRIKHGGRVYYDLADVDKVLGKD
jgi:hypothetical protein